MHRNKKPKQLLAHVQHGQRDGSRAPDDGTTTSRTSRNVAAMQLTPSQFLEILYWLFRTRLWILTVMLCSVDTYQNKVSADKYRFTMSPAQVYSSFKLTADQVPVFDWIAGSYQVRYECCAAQHYEHKWWNRELTLKCKLKCYVKPMKDPLGVSPSKGNQGTTRGKEKILSWVSHSNMATRRNIHMYPYFLFAAIHHLNRPRLSLSDLAAQSAE